MIAWGSCTPPHSVLGYIAVLLFRPFTRAYETFLEHSFLSDFLSSLLLWYWHFLSVYFTQNFHLDIIPTIMTMRTVEGFARKVRSYPQL